jgi:hypothetical protein
MNIILQEQAYSQAVIRYEEALQALQSDLRSANTGAATDDILVAAHRAMELHLTSIGLAKNIRAKAISYDKALTSLLAIFPDFPAHVCSQALSESYKRER